MILLGRKKLKDFFLKHPKARIPISAWIAEAEKANWKSPGEIKERYTSASILKNNVIIFNIGGNKYRLQTQIAFKTGKIIVIRIGTHAEYDDWSS